MIKLLIDYVLTLSLSFHVAAFQKNDANKFLNMQEAQLWFNQILSNTHQGRYEKAIALLLEFSKSAPATFDNYGLAQYLLAKNLDHLGLDYAAATYYMLVAKSRFAPELIVKSLTSLMDLTEHAANDIESIQQFLGEEDFGLLPKNIQSFVAYHQGYVDLTLSHEEWAKRRFSLIEQNSLYSKKAAYALAVYHLKKNNDKEGIAELETLLENTDKKNPVYSDTLLALARMYFEKQEFVRAWQFYQKVSHELNSFSTAEVLIEKAWTVYLLNDFKKTLGYTHALEAPNFSRYFLPEMYVIKILSLSALCQHFSAKLNIEQFKAKFFIILRQLANRDKQEDIESLRKGAVWATENPWRTQLLRALQQQLAEISTGRLNEKSKTYLKNIYNNAIDVHEKIWQQEQKVLYNKLSNQLLEAQQRLEVLNYDIELKINNTQKNVILPEKKVKVIFSDQKINYPDNSEYWFDELDAYEITLQDRCKKEKL